MRHAPLRSSSHASGGLVAAITSAGRWEPAGVYNASNMSTRCFVFPWRICFSVLYLSRPAATIFLYSWSLWVSADCSLAASNSALSDYSHNSHMSQCIIIVIISPGSLLTFVIHTQCRKYRILLNTIELYKGQLLHSEWVSSLRYHSTHNRSFWRCLSGNQLH